MTDEEIRELAGRLFPTSGTTWIEKTIKKLWDVGLLSNDWAGQLQLANEKLDEANKALEQSSHKLVELAITEAKLAEANKQIESLQQELEGVKVKLRHYELSYWEERKEKNTLTERIREQVRESEGKV